MIFLKKLQTLQVCSSKYIYKLIHVTAIQKRNIRDKGDFRDVEFEGEKKKRHQILGLGQLRGQGKRSTPQFWELRTKQVCVHLLHGINSPPSWNSVSLSIKKSFQVLPKLIQLFFGFELKIVQT